MTNWLERKITEEVDLLTDIDDSVGIEIGGGKGLFFQVVDYGAGKEYLIELNDIVDGAFEPCAEYNASSVFGDLEALISIVERYLESQIRPKWKRKKIDFVLNEFDNEILIFRFYPKSSSCHSFGPVPPKTWEEVYKVYYCYSIIRRYKDNNVSKIVFDSSCDECSIIDEVAERCLLLSEGKEEVAGIVEGEEYLIKLLDNEMYPSGTGVFWNISKCGDDWYTFDLFNLDDIGFRFSLSKKQVKAFGEYLKGCCEYMLEHGDPV